MPWLGVRADAALTLNERVINKEKIKKIQEKQL
jgi:hypothetical protein